VTDGQKRTIVKRVIQRVLNESPFVEKSEYTLATLERILREELDRVDV
jgi:hypothetical protein